MEGAKKEREKKGAMLKYFHVNKRHVAISNYTFQGVMKEILMYIFAFTHTGDLCFSFYVQVCLFM